MKFQSLPTLSVTRGFPRFLVTGARVHVYKYITHIRPPQVIP